VQLSGTVKDNTVIKAKSLEVKLTAASAKMQVVFGECDLEVGDQPTREKAADKPQENGKSAPPPETT
jgi:hypothetical protein